MWTWHGTPANEETYFDLNFYHFYLLIVLQVQNIQLARKKRGKKFKILWFLAWREFRFGLILRNPFWTDPDLVNFQFITVAVL